MIDPSDIQESGERMLFDKTTWAAVCFLGVLAGCGADTARDSECRTASDCGVNTDCLTYDCQNTTCRNERDTPGTVCGVGGLGICDASGFCMMKKHKVQGEGCAAAGECESGHCVDGVCCDAVCDGACERCDTEDAPGRCTTSPPGAVGSPACTPYVCDGSGTGCPSTCNESSDCVSNRFCDGDAGRCAAAPRGVGDACSTPSECDSGHCVDGLCCNAACTDACEACHQAATGLGDGACAPVASGMECRSSQGPCDPADLCDGVAAECPADILHDSSIECRAASGGGCDVAELCSGDSPACPENGYAAASIECRAASGGGCDVAELC
ncbi:MAG: hypothetical protein ACI9OJ_005272, partial [Myxococcota bacterium]